MPQVFGRPGGLWAGNDPGQHSFVPAGGTQSEVFPMRTLIASSAVVAIVVTTAPSTAFAQTQQEQTPQNRFCLETGTEGQARCAYQTLTQCQRAQPRGSTGRCFDRTYMIAATTPDETAAADRSSSPRGGKRGRSSR